MALDINCGVGTIAPFVPKTEREGFSLVNSFTLPTLYTNDVGTYVDDALANSQGLADKYSALAEQALNALGTFPTVAVDRPDTSLQIDEAPDFDASAAKPPTPPAITTPDTSGMPSPRGELLDIQVNGPAEFTETPPDAPTEVLDFHEDPYIGPLLERLQAIIEDVLLNGGTGISAEYEELIRERALARSQLEHEAKYNEAENYYAAKGYTAPPGALIARLNMLNREKLRNDNLLNGEITAKLLEEARRHGEFMADLGVKLEGLTMEQKAGVSTRALEAAKAYVTLLYDAYGKKMEGFKARAGVYKTQWEAEGIRVGAIASHNDSITKMYDSELKAFTTRLEAEIAIIEQIVKIYIAEVSGYEANVKAEVAKLEGLIESYKAKLHGEEVKGTLSVEEFKALVQKAIAEVSLRITSQQEVGRIAAQISASALGVFNASASLSESKNKSASYSEGKNISYSESFSQGISESYGVNVGASCNKSQSESFNYSASVSA